MSVSGIEGLSGMGGFTPLTMPKLDAASAVNGSSGVADGAGSTGSVGGTDGGQKFGDMVIDGIDRLQGLQQNSDNLAVKAATGDLNAIHHYTIAATESAVTTQLTVAVRNKALEAFNEIMRMPV